MHNPPAVAGRATFTVTPVLTSRPSRLAHHCKMKRFPLFGRAAQDALQREHTVTRNVPLVGHARYLIETVGPELRNTR